MKLVPEQSNDGPIIAAFKEYSVELTARHDRHERLVRISRDITTESKRIICFLHSLGSRPDAEQLNSAETRITALAEGPLKKAAAELRVGTSTSVSVVRVINPAIEELSEAYCLLHHLKYPQSIDIPSWMDLQTIITAPNDSTQAPFLQMRPIEFMLGVMDFTGELMRQCINRASTADSESCFEQCKLMQQIYMKFLGISYNKDVYKKITTLKQSLQKVEEACYKIRLRNLQL